MPQFPFSQALTANQLGFNPLAVAVRVSPMASADPAARSSNGQQRTHDHLFGQRDNSGALACPGGGTAGVTPTEFTTAPVSFIAAAVID